MWPRLRAQQSSSPKQWISVQSQLVPRTKEPPARQQPGADDYLKTLNRELILESQSASDGLERPTELQAVERIALSHQQVGWLEEEAILSCVRLRICNLSGCYVQDIGALYGSVNLLKLDLSDNEISLLPPEEFWVSLVSLQVLYLDGNLINDRESIQFMNGCPRLHVLTLYNTPISLTRGYRHHVVNSIFSLKALDQYIISDQEIIENFYVTESFRAFGNFFRLPLRISIKPLMSVRDELRQVFRLLLAVDRILAKHSPVLIVQRYIRSHLARKQLSKSPNLKIRKFLTKHGRRYLLPDRTAPLSPYALQRPLVVVTPPPVDKAPPLPTSDGPGEHRTRFLRLGDHGAKDGGQPPPPPSSPRTPRGVVVSQSVTTHVLGVDSKSSKLRYSMHINLGRLQHSIEQSDKNPEVVEVSRGVLKRSKGGGRRERGEGVGRSKSWDVQSSRTHKVRFRTQDTRTQDTRTQDSRTHDSRTVDTRTQYFRREETSDSKDIKTEPEGEGEVGQVGVVKVATTPGPDSKPDQKMEVAGLTVAILPGEGLPELITSKRENVEMFRQAERQICKQLLRLKQPVPRHKPSEEDGMSKNDFSFTRVYGTMGLSALRKVDKVQQTRKNKEEMKEKVDKVAKVRRERVLRRGQIEAYQKRLKERVQLWKCEEEGRLEQKRDELEKEHQVKVEATKRRTKASQLNTCKHKEEREFSSNFRQNSTLISNTLSAEDRSASLTSSSAKVKERVKQTKEDSWEQQEEVRKYLEHRRNKILQEGKEGRQQVDTRTLELASQQMIEAKQRIAKEVARKATARVAIAMAKEEMRVEHRGPGEGMPSSSKGLVIRTTDSAPPAQDAGSKFKSPSHAHNLTNRNHYTWQRGVEAIARDNHQFPVLLGCEDPAPFLYHRLPSREAHRVKKSAAETPFTELNSSTHSITGVQLAKMSLSTC